MAPIGADPPHTPAKKQDASTQNAPERKRKEKDGVYRLLSNSCRISHSGEREKLEGEDDLAHGLVSAREQQVRDAPRRAYPQDQQQLRDRSNKLRPVVAEGDAEQAQGEGRTRSATTPE